MKVEESSCSPNLLFTELSSSDTSVKLEKQ